jgi:hypothetical protein
LKLVSDKPAWLLAYGICDADSCFTKEERAGGCYCIIASEDTIGLENKTDLSLWSGHVIQWITLRDGYDSSGATSHWKAGDIVHVIVKVEPAVMIEKNNIRKWEPIENVVGNSADDNNNGSAEQRRQTKAAAAGIATDLGESRIIDVQYGP